jgi:hypothetical protein
MQGMILIRFFPIALTQACPDDLATVEGTVGEWHRVLELVVHLIIGDGSTQNAMPCVRLEFFKNINHPSIIGSCNTEQVIF